jgi:hypothetical protein
MIMKLKSLVGILHLFSRLQEQLITMKTRDLTPFPKAEHSSGDQRPSESAADW